MIAPRGAHQGNDRDDVHSEGDSAVSHDKKMSLGIMDIERHPSEKTEDLWRRDTLPTDLEVELLRGIGMDKVLRCFGNAFNSNAGAQFDFDCAVRTRRLSQFISHDWETSRLGKAFALCLICNGTAASIGSICIAFVLSALELVGLISSPRSPPHTSGTKGYHTSIWSSLICPWVFVVLFVFWQDIRSKLYRELVFVDKFCINQVDRRQKAKAVLGLAAFLKHSDRLVVLWTPRYFTRLWCTYEIASWLFLRKPMKSVIFMPISLAFYAGVEWLISVCIYVFFLSARMTNPVDVTFPWVIIIPLMLSYPATHFGRRFMKQMRELPSQLEKFSLDDANCYCCTHNHIDPNNGQEMPCDRELVYRTIWSWFENADHTPCTRSMLFASFHGEIRKLFGPFILESAGPTNLPYKYMMIGSVPSIWRVLDVAVCFGTWEVAWPAKLCKVIEYLTHYFLTVPIIAKVSLYTLVMSDRFIGIPKNRYLDIMTNVLVSLCVMSTMVGFYLPVALFSDGTVAQTFSGYIIFCVLVLFYAGLIFGLCSPRALLHLLGWQSPAQSFTAQTSLISDLPEISARPETNILDRRFTPATTSTGSTMASNRAFDRPSPQQPARKSSKADASCPELSAPLVEADIVGRRLESI